MRSLKLLPLLGIALGAGTLGLTRTVWLHATAMDLTGTAVAQNVVGSSAAPAAAALAVVVIAAFLALSLIHI